MVNDEEKNLMSTIEDCLKEHRVDLKSDKGVVPMYLIEVTAQSSLYDDFVKTYEGEVDEFKKKLAKKVMGLAWVDQKYGVLINTDLKYEFAFNRRFADIDKKAKKIVYKDVEDVLLDMSNEVDLSEQESVNELADQLEQQTGPSLFPGNAVFRYSVVGKKSKKKKEKNLGKVEFEKQSLLGRIQTQYADRFVDVKFSGQRQKRELCLIETEYKTKTINDFMKIYGDEISDFQKKLAKQIFGKKKTNNEYIFMLDKNMQIVFAYNRMFCAYDFQTKKLVYTPVEQVLLQNNKDRDLSETGDFRKVETKVKKRQGPVHPLDDSANIPPAPRSPFEPPKPRFRSSPRRSSTKFKYSIIGK